MLEHVDTRRGGQRTEDVDMALLKQLRASPLALLNDELRRRRSAALRTAFR
jgi:hypothetical protein